MRVLPLMLGDKIPEDDDHWELLISLCEIMAVVFAPAITSEATYFLQHQIADHLELFKELFSEARLRPKQHYMTHYFRSIRLVGPLVRFWAMRFEAKHNFFRRLSHIVCNFKNICKTMSVRHQLTQCYRFYSKPPIDSRALEIGSGSITVLANVESSSILSQLLKHGLYEDLFCATWVKYNGVMYRPGMGLLLDVDTESENPLFGKILYIFFLDGVVHFILQLWQTQYFHRHMFAYCVDRMEPPLLRAATPKSIMDPQPVHFRASNQEGNNKCYIVMKHKP